MPDAQNPFFYFLGFCYGIPPAVHEAGCRISFGICVIPAERQTAGAPQWCHMPCCHFVKSLTPAAVPGELLLWPRVRAGSSTAPSQLQRFGPEEHQLLLQLPLLLSYQPKVLTLTLNQELMVSQRWDNVHKKGAQSSNLQAKWNYCHVQHGRSQGWEQMGTRLPEKQLSNGSWCSS